MAIQEVARGLLSLETEINTRSLDQAVRRASDLITKQLDAATKTAAKSMEDNIDRGMDKVERNVKASLKRLQTSFDSFASSIIRTMTRTFTSIGQSADNAVNRLRARWNTAFQGMSDTAQRALTAVSQAISRIPAGSDQAFRTLTTNATRAFNALRSTAESTGQSLSRSITNAVRTASTQLGSLSRPINVSVRPVVEQTTLRSLPPVDLPVRPIVQAISRLEPQVLPVIPEIVQSIATLQPLIVPVIPVIAPAALEGIEIPVKASTAAIDKAVDEIETGVQRGLEGVSTEIKVNIDTAFAERQLAKLQAQLDELDNKAVDIAFEGASLDAVGDLQAQIENLKIEASNIDLNVSTHPEQIQQVAQRVEELKRSVGTLGLSVGLEADEPRAVGVIARIGQAIKEKFTGELAEAGRLNIGEIGGRSLELLRAAVQRAGPSIKQFGADVTTVFKTVENAVERGVGKIGSSIKNFVSGILSQAKQALFQFSGVATLVFGSISAAGAVRAAADLQTLKVALAGIFPANAEEAFAKITAFAAKTPFEVAPLTDSIIKLGASFGFSVDQAIDFLTIIGDAGSAAGKSAGEIQGAVLAITQIGAAGRLTSQDLNQISSAIPTISRVKVYQELGKLLGEVEGGAAKSSAEVQKLAEQGLIPSEIAIKAILNVAKDAPGALGAMGRQAKTLNGIISTMHDTFNLLAFDALKPVIELFGEIVDPLLNSGDALNNLRAAAQRFGEQAAAGIKAFVKEFGPQFGAIFAEAGKAISNLFGIISSGLPAAIGLFRIALDSIQLLLRAFNQIATVARPVIAVIGQIAGAILNFRPLVLIIEALVVKFLLLRGITFVATLFQQLAVGAGVLIQRLSTMVSTSGGVVNAFNSMGSGATKFAGAVNAAATIATVAFAIIQESANNASKKANEALTAATTAANQAAKAGLTPLEQVDTQIKSLGDSSSTAEKRLKDLGASTKGGFFEDFKRGLFSTDPIGDIIKQRDIDAQRKIVEESNKTANALKVDREIYREFIDTVARATGKPFEETAKSIAEMGINVGDVSGDLTLFDQLAKKVTDTLLGTGDAANSAGNAIASLDDRIKTSLGNIGDIDQLTKLNDAVVKAEKDLAEGRDQQASLAADAAAKVKAAEADLADLRLNGAARAARAVQDAEVGLQEARNQSSALAEKLVALEARRKVLLADTTADLKEIAAQEREIANIRQQLVDLDEREVDLRTHLAELERDRPFDIAESVRGEERARIALSRAIRAENELKNGLNDTNATEVNLAGLTLDQARIKLAAVRATLAAQKQGTKTVADEGEKADNIKSARLDVLDAEEALRDAINARGKIEATLDAQKREDLEGLSQLDRDRQALLDTFGEAEQRLRELRAGDTTRARELKQLEIDIRDTKLQQVTAANAVKAAEDRVTQAKREQATLGDRILAAERAVTDAKRQQESVSKNISTLEKAVTDAKEAQRLKTAELARDERTINQILLERLEIAKKAGLIPKQLEEEVIKNLAVPIAADIKNEFKEILSFEKDFGDFRLDANQIARDSEIATLSSAIQTLEPLFRNAQTGAAVDLSNTAIRSIAEQLVDSPDNDLAKVLREILRRLGINTSILGFAQGGYVPGAPGPTGRLMQVGGAMAHIAEFSKPEAVLPLTNQFRMKALMNDPRILHPILDALPRISLSGAQPSNKLNDRVIRNAAIAAAAPAVRQYTASYETSALRTTVNNRQQQEAMSRAEERRRDAELEERVYQGMKRALSEAGTGDTPNVTVQMSSTGITDLDARKLVNEVVRQIERKIR